MKPPLSLPFTVTLLLIAAHRLPAPIQEVPQSPTPGPTVAPAEKSPPKPKSKPSGAAQFAGTWTGRIKIGSEGDFDVTLVVDSEATSLTQSTNRSPQHVHPTITSGRTLLWRGGNLNNVAWTLTPNRDGRTALATTKMGGIGYNAIFHRVP